MKKNSNRGARPYVPVRYGRPRVRTAHTYLLQQMSIAFVLTLGAGAPFAWAAPQGGQVVAGAASISQSGPLTTIEQQSQRAIVNWQSFGINPNETVRFQQPGLNAAILNRVVGNLPTNINGLLQGNGKVFLVNPNGIVVGANGVVNVQGGFVASTQDMSDTAFMQGGALLLSGRNDGSIEILGAVSTPGGEVTIVAPKVEVAASAHLTAGSAVQLVAASNVTLSNGQFTVMPTSSDAGQLTVQGVIDAAKVQLAAVNGNLGALAINTGGTIRANGTQSNPDGSISIVAQGAGGNARVGGTLTASGASGSGGKIAVRGANVTVGDATLDVSGHQGGDVSVTADTAFGTALITDSTIAARGNAGTGGLVRITGRNTGLTRATLVDASGSAGGGTILVGGGMHGADSRIADATATTVGSGVTLSANGTQGNANAGEVVVWSNDATRFAGTIHAAGRGTGSGGQAEVSGAGTLDYRGFADLTGGSNGGAFGALLLDPTDVTIQAAGSDSGATWSGGAANFSSSGGSSIITVATLQSQLASANVTIDSHGGTGGNGDISVNNAVVIPDARSLTLNAAGDINLNANVTTNSTGSLTSFNAYANRNINVNGVTLGGTSGLSSVTLVSGLGAYGSTTQATPTLSSTAAWLPSYAGVVNFGAGSTLDTTRGLTVITGCSVACPSYAADTALTLANSTGVPPDLTINGAAAAGNVTLSNTDQGTVYFGGFRDIKVAGQVGSGGGLYLYGLRDIAINAPLQMTGWDWMKSERDVYLNANVTGTQLLQVDAARDVHVSTGVLQSAGGFGVRLWAGQRDTTAADLALGAGSLYKLGAVYFNGNGAGGATQLQSDSNIEVLSGCKTAVNCLSTDRTDFLPANVVLEKPTGATFGSVRVEGFRNITPERLDPATNAYASDITATNDINFLAFGNLTLDQTALTAGTSLYLQAAGGNPSDPSPRSGATLADYAGLVKFTQYGISPITLSATGDLTIISGTDGTGTGLGGAGGTLPSGGAYSGSRTNQARPDFNDASAPNNITLKYGSSANAFSGSVTIQGFRQTLLNLDNFDGTPATSLTARNGINVFAYGDIILPTQMQYVRALGGNASVSLQSGGGVGLVGQMIFTNANPVIQSDNWVWVNSGVDSTGKYLDFRGGNGTLTGGYGTGQPILLQYAPGEDSFGVVGITGFQNADIYAFASSVAAPSVASFDPSVPFKIRAGAPANSFIRVAKDLTLHNATFTATAGSGLDLSAGECWWSCSNNNDGVLTFSAPAATFTGWWNSINLSNDSSGRATTTTNPNGTDLTNVSFTNIGKLPTTPLTALIGGSTVTLNAPVTPVLNNLTINGFRNVDLKTGSSTEPLSVTNLNILPNGNSIQGDIKVDANVYASNQVYLTGSSINTGSNIISSLAPANASYDARFFATGLSTVWGEAAQNSTINTSSKNNSKSGGMQIGNAAAGTTMTINDRDSVVIGSFGAPTDQGNIVVNAQGDIGVNGDIVRTGATNPASITLNADKNLSSTFTGFDAYDQGTVSAAVQAQNVAGGDGVGVTYFLAPVERVVPIYKQVVLLSLQSTNAAGTDYVAPSDPGWNAAKTQYTVSSSSPAGLLFYFPVGTVVTPGQTILTTGFNSAIAVMANYARPVTSGGQQVYVVTGYTTSTAAQAQMTSLGFGVNTVSGTVNNGATGTTLTSTLNRTSFAVAGDNPVVDALVTPTGDPVAGTYALGVAQQFYVAAGGNPVYPDASWNVRVTGPVTVQTQLGNIVVKSGSTYADSYQGFHTAGDTADVRLSSSVPAAGQGLGHPENMQQNLVTKTVNGNVLIGGYRDIIALDANAVQPTGTGNISLIAGRDLLLQDNIGVANSGTLTLGAGNMIQQTAGKTIAANNLVLLTGRGSNNLQADVNNLAGYLQMPSAAYTGALAGGTTPTGTLEITNDKMLNVVSNIPANPVTGAVTFTTNGPVFADPTVTPLQPKGLTTSTLGGAIAGSIELTTTSGDINLNAPVTTTATGGEINVKATTGNVALNAPVTTTGNVFIQAGQAITDNGGATSVVTAQGAVLTAGTTVGTAASPVQTAVKTLAVVSGGNAYVSNAGSLTAAGQTANNGSLLVTANGGALTVGSVNLQPIIVNNAPGANLTGMNANGSGAVTLVATGATGDVVFDATARSGTGTVSVTAGRNIVEAQTDLVPGAESSVSMSLAVATSGNVVLIAGDTMGGDGVSTIDPLSVWSGGTISATSGGTANASGTYLDVLDTTGAVTIGGGSVQVNSAHNVDVTAVASTRANSGNLIVAGPVAARNAGYVRLAADRNETINGPVSTTGAGNVVLRAGLTGTGSVTQSATGTLSSGTGEINMKAANGITLGANAGTGGKIVTQAGTAIASTGGTLTAAGVALQAGTTIGAAGNAINTATGTLAMSSPGNQYVANTGNVTLGAQTSSNGSINVTNAGVLTVGSASALTGITVPGLTGGITTVAPGVSIIGVTANGTGNVNLTATGAMGDIVTTQAVSSGTGNIVMTAARNVTDTATGLVTTGGSGTIGVSAQTGSITMADGSSYTTAGGNIAATATNNIALAQATTGSNMAGTVTLTATNGAISNNRTAGANNVTAGTLNATAATGIGSGTLDSAPALTTNVATLGTKVTGTGDAVIDNTNTSQLTLGNGALTNSAANGSVRVATASAITTGNSVSASNTVQLITGDTGGTLANNVGTVTLANNVTANTLNINSGGLVQQTGGTLTAGTTQVDATRYTSGSDATLANGSGTLTENGSSVTGNYTITMAGTLNQTGNTTVGGNLTESGYTAGTVSGTVTVGGNYSGVNPFSGSGSVTTGGSNSTINANATTTGVVMATGAGPNFDLSGVNLGNSTNITVDLRGQSATVAGNTQAILLNGASGGSNSLGTVTVKTAKPVTVVVTQQDYNLVQSSAINLGTRTLTVNAVAGNASSASLQASPGTIQVLGTQTGIDYNAANNTLNGGLGSRIVLNNAGNTIGGLSIANAESANVATTGNLALGNVALNNGLSASSIGGAITQTAGTSVAARTLELSAVNGIGTSAAPIDFSTAAAVSARATPVLATTDGPGNTFVDATGQVQLGGSVYHVTDMSAATSSTLTTAANSTTAGNLSVAAAGPVTTGQTVSTGGNGNVNIDTSAGSVTLSSTVTAGGSGSMRLAAASDLNVNAAVSSTSGEVNARAYNGNVALGANVSTTGNAFVQASNAITQSVGTLAANSAVLTAATVGSGASPVKTDVNTLALASGGDATVVNDKAMTLAAQTRNNGSVSATTTNGALTVGSALLSPTITNNAVGANLSGVAANGTGNVSLSASGTGGNIVAENNVTSGMGTIAATTSGNVTFDNSAQMATASTVALTAGGDIVNNTTNSVPQIQAAGTTLTAGGNVGSGIIDNGITGTTNANALYLNVSDLTVSTGGNATMRNEAATVLETSAAGSYFGLNGGGAITQASGATLRAGSVEFDTTRNATIGQVALQNSGDLTIAGANYAGGDYAATSQTGNVTLTGTLNVNGNVALTSGAGGTVSASPTSIASSGSVMQNGATTNIGGARMPLITIDSATKTARINAQGAGADFVLMPTLVSQLKAAGVTTVTVDLGNTTTSYAVASLTGPAITVANANNAVSGGWTVRTGTAALGTPIQAVRNYNLTDAAGPLDLSGTSVIVNAARGTAYAPGATPSAVAAVSNGANAAAGFNAEQGSNVTLTQTAVGSLDVRDAYDASVSTPNSLDVSYIDANHDIVLRAGISTSGNLNVNGNMTAGDALIGVGGRDVNIATGKTVRAVGPVTLIADETAGTNAGPGWFVNQGRIHSDADQVAIYGVAGNTPAGYAPVVNQVVLGDIDGFSGSVPIGDWATNYDSTTHGVLYAAGTGKLGGAEVFYKKSLTAMFDVSALRARVLAVPRSQLLPIPTHHESDDPLILSAGFTMRGGCGTGQYAGTGRLARAGGVEYDIGVPTFMNTVTRQFGSVRGARYDAAHEPTLDCISERAFDGIEAAPGPIVAAHFSLDADVLFSFDRSSAHDMLPGGRESLDQIVAKLRTDYRSLRSVSIIGHTDRIGSNAYNRALSLARAQTVRDYLVAHGLPSAPVMVAGVGNGQPVTKDCPAGRTAESIRCLQPDRRVTIDVIGEQRQGERHPSVRPEALPPRLDAAAPDIGMGILSAR